MWWVSHFQLRRLPRVAADTARFALACALAVGEVCFANESSVGRGRGQANALSGGNTVTSATVLSAALRWEDDSRWIKGLEKSLQGVAIAVIRGFVIEEFEQRLRKDVRDGALSEGSTDAKEALLATAMGHVATIHVRLAELATRDPELEAALLAYAAEANRLAEGTMQFGMPGGNLVKSDSELDRRVRALGPDTRDQAWVDILQHVKAMDRIAQNLLAQISMTPSLAAQPQLRSR